MKTRRTTLHIAGKSALILLAIGATCCLWAAGNAIGTVTTNGNFHLDHSRIWGNGTLFDGSLVQTAGAASQIQLNNGIQMRLGADTRAMIFQSRMVLEGGQSEMAPVNGYAVEARTLRITAGSADALARVKLDNGRRVLVASVRGILKVANAAGMMVARIEAGEALNFEPQPAGAMAATHASGCLLEKDGKFILVDRTTNVVLEVKGPELGKQLGNRVDITGSADAAQVITVADLKLVAKGGCTAVAKKVGAVAAAGAAGAGAAGAAGASGAAGAAGAASAGAAAAGIGAGTVAVIGGVAAAATVGGLAAVGDLPGQGSSEPSTSR